MQTTIEGMVKIMKAVNATTSTNKQLRILHEYERQSANAEIRQDFLEDMLNSTEQDDDDEEREIASAILDELGIKVEGSMPSVSPKPASEFESLSQRLEALKK
jgi:hypothetical protein